jgi:hypothetical protein
MEGDAADRPRRAAIASEADENLARTLEFPSGSKGLAALKLHRLIGATGEQSFGGLGPFWTGAPHLGDPDHCLQCPALIGVRLK